MNRPSYVPEGYNVLIPALAFNGAEKAMKWYQEVFNAQEKMKFLDNDGKIAHGELIIGDSTFMLSEEYPQYNKTPKTLGGNTINLCLYVPNVDEVIQKAVDLGAKLLMPAEDQFYGDRSGRIEDPFGYIWIISTHIKQVSVEEMQKHMEGAGANSE